MELIGRKSSFSGTFGMMNEELRQPATARARDCQAVRAGVWCVTGGMDTPGDRHKSTSTMQQQRGWHRRPTCKQQSKARGVSATLDNEPTTAHRQALASWCEWCEELVRAAANLPLLLQLNEDIE